MYRRSAIIETVNSAVIKHSNLLSCSFTQYNKNILYLYKNTTKKTTDNVHACRFYHKITQIFYLNLSYAFTNISSLPMARIANQSSTIPTKGKQTTHEGTKVDSPLSINTNVTKVA